MFFLSILDMFYNYFLLVDMPSFAKSALKLLFIITHLTVMSSVYCRWFHWLGISHWVHVGSYVRITSEVLLSNSGERNFLFDLLHCHLL